MSTTIDKNSNDKQQQQHTYSTVTGLSDAKSTATASAAATLAAKSTPTATKALPTMSVAGIGGGIGGGGGQTAQQQVPPLPPPPPITSNKRLYRSATIISSPNPITTNTTNSILAMTDNTTGRGGDRNSGTTVGSTTSSTATTTMTKWVTREIASLDFLLNVPLAAEQEIVWTGYQLQIQRELDYYKNHNNHRSSSSSSSSSNSNTSQSKSLSSSNMQKQRYDKKVSFNETNMNQNQYSTTTTTTIPSWAKGRWWEKWIIHHHNSNMNQQLTAAINNNNSKNLTSSDTDELEEPTDADRKNMNPNTPTSTSATSGTKVNVLKNSNVPNTTTTTTTIPGRRLDGDYAIRIQIPVTTKTTIAALGNIGVNSSNTGTTGNIATKNSTNTSNNMNPIQKGTTATAVAGTVTTSAVLTKQTSIARQAALREWEIFTAFGGKTTAITTSSSTTTNNQGHTSSSASTMTTATATTGTMTPQHNQNMIIDQPPMLDGRLFFSANSGYPVSIFSVIRYEPRKEEAAFRRRKLEAIGGGGSQFVLPNRDWRGISYRALLRRSGDDKKEDKKFNRFVQTDTNQVDGSSHKKNGEKKDDDSSTTSSSSSSSSDDSYVPGLLDDPNMVLGRHRNVMIGDRVTGPIVSSTIQFVKPAVLKAELNKQFRERFDGWEPPKKARKYIGAKVIQGNYTLVDPADEYDEQSYDQNRRRPRQGSVTSMSASAGGSETGGVGGGGAKEYTIRMPPSLTLSKIRSVKTQALHAAVKANLEIGTVALACIYFERLCLDCRVDKSNRRVTFAACLLLAVKLNEPNVGLVMEREKKRDKAAQTTTLSSNDEKQPTRFQSLIRPNKRSDNMFASLLLFLHKNGICPSSIYSQWNGEYLLR